MVNPPLVQRMRAAVVKGGRLKTGEEFLMAKSIVGRIPAAATLLALAGTPQIVGAGTIDFSDLPIGGYHIVSGDQYQSQGVLFSTNGAALQANRNLPTDNFICGTSTPALGGNCDSQLIVDFVLPGTSIPGYTSSVDFFVINDSAPTSTFLISVFGPGGALLTEIPGAMFTPFSLFRPEGDINRVVLTPLVSLHALGAPFNFGEITSAPAVPEPGTLALVTAGVLAIVARRRSSS
jgi:hypothetical protein